MMRAGDRAKIALRNTARARGRSLLATLAVAVGIASVMLISSVGSGSRQMIDRELTQLGIDGLTVYKTSGSAERGIDPQTALFIEKRVGSVQSAMPYTTEYGSFRMRAQSGSAVILGIGEKLRETLDIEVLHGRTPSASEVKNASNVAVVDDVLANRLYKRSNIVGKVIELTVGGKTDKYTIIGVISSQKRSIDGLLGDTMPDFVYIPYTRSGLTVSNNGVNQIAVRCVANADTNKTGEDIIALLNKYHASQGKFGVENISGFMDEVRNIAGLVTLLITAVGGISLAVAGMGVMNSMLSSIASRRREIGIYLALGATQQDIVICFLLEAVFLCMAGGVIGIVAGYGAAYLAARIGSLPFSGSWIQLGSALGVSIICGVLSGVVPALRASKMEPIDALREE